MDGMRKLTLATGAALHTNPTSVEVAESLSLAQGLLAFSPNFLRPDTILVKTV
jgi:hypothetical protein